MHNNRVRLLIYPDISLSTLFTVRPSEIFLDEKRKSHKITLKFCKYVSLNGLPFEHEKYQFIVI